MKFITLHKILLSLSGLFILGLLFQNCNSNLNAQKHLLKASSLLSGSNLLLDRNPLNVNNVTNSKYHSTSRGFIFYGKHEVALQGFDKTGAQICDYPSLNNCHVNAEGRGRGASTIINSGLNPNSNVHAVSFQFYSDGFLTKNINSHFASGLRGTLFTDKDGNSIGVEGRGAILGNLWGIPKNQSNSACQGMMMQIESYFASQHLANKGPGNDVFPASCSGAIFHEKTYYNMEVYVSRDNKIGYIVKDVNGVVLTKKLISDPYDLIDKNLTGFFIAHVFDIDINSKNDEWSFIIDKINFKESNSSIEGFFNLTSQQNPPQNSPPTNTPAPANNPVPTPTLPPIVSQPIAQPVAVAPAPVVVTPVVTVVIPFSFEDSSYGNGTVVTRLVQTIKGAGKNVRACTNPIRFINSACKKDSDFALLTQAWGEAYYKVIGDVWIVNLDVSTKGYPFEDYFTRFILPDGTTKIVTFKPSRAD